MDANSINAIKKLKELAPREFNKINDAYRNVAYKNYFSLHPIIFMYNTGKRNIGKVIAVKNIQLKDIDIHSVTSGTIKPMVQL